MQNVTRNSDVKDILFIHSGFRTSSTWLWLKLRGMKDIKAYYEPFNEALATMSKGEACSLDPSLWNSHHPISEPYFLEFVDLIAEGGGVQQFKSEMAFENHIPRDGVNGDLSGAEIEYINFLIDSALETGRRAALCDTRSLGRSRAIHKIFGGTHVLLTRNLHEQWCSFAEQAADGNNYFYDSFFRQIEFSKHDPFLRRLADLADKTADNADISEIYVVFLLFQLYLNAVAFDVCKIKIEVSKIAKCTAERADAETRLSQLLHSQVDLSDVKAHVSFDTLEAQSRNSTEKRARQILSEMTIPNASSECKDFVQRAFNDAFESWDQSIYYGEASRTFLRKKINLERINASDESARLSALSAQIQKQLACSKQELSDTRQELAATKQELLGSRQELAAAKQELSGSRQELAAAKVYLQSSRLYRMLFRYNGRPIKPLRRALFHKSGKPRSIFRRIVLKKNGQPRPTFRQWMTGQAYLLLPNAYYPPGSVAVYDQIAYPESIVVSETKLDEMSDREVALFNQLKQYYGSVD